MAPSKAAPIERRDLLYPDLGSTHRGRGHLSAGRRTSLGTILLRAIDLVQLRLLRRRESRDHDSGLGAVLLSAWAWKISMHFHDAPFGDEGTGGGASQQQHLLGGT